MALAQGVPAQARAKGRFATSARSPGEKPLRVPSAKTRRARTSLFTGSLVLKKASPPAKRTTTR